MGTAAVIETAISRTRPALTVRPGIVFSETVDSWRLPPSVAPAVFHRDCSVAGRLVDWFPLGR